MERSSAAPGLVSVAGACMRHSSVSYLWGKVRVGGAMVTEVGTETTEVLCVPQSQIQLDRRSGSQRWHYGGSVDIFIVSQKETSEEWKRV